MLGRNSSLTPQQRWQHFRENHLPKLSRRQQWIIVGSTFLILIIFVTTLLPFILPLTGPEAQSPESLADKNGAFVEIDGLRMYYVHESPTSDTKTDTPAETVILIHGQMGSTLTWKETIPALSTAGFDVYAIDLMGSGLSEKSWDIDYSHPAQMERLIAFMDAQNIQQAHLVAHAFGGNLATMIALSYPERVKTLVLVAPTLFFGSTAQIPALVFDLPFLKRWTRVLIQLVLPDAVAEQLRSAVKEDDVVTSELVEDYSRGLSIEGWDEAAMGMARDFHKNALTISLTELQNPVLFMWGAEDGWASSSLIEDIQDELYSMERIDFEGVGHLPMHEVPEDFNAGLIEFLENNQ